MKTLAQLKNLAKSAPPAKIDVAAVLSERTFTAFEAASHRNVGVETIWRWIRLGKLKAGEVRGRRMILASEIARIKLYEFNKSLTMLPSLPVSQE